MSSSRNPSALRFGAASAGAIPALVLDPGFAARYQRGDTQILGRHAVALLGSLELTPDLAVSVLALASPADGSGVFAPSATVTLGPSVSLLASFYLPFGRSPQGLSLRSEYGATPIAALLQLRIYD